MCEGIIRRHSNIKDDLPVARSLLFLFLSLLQFVFVWDRLSHDFTSQQKFWHYHNLKHVPAIRHLQYRAPQLPLRALRSGTNDPKRCNRLGSGNPSLKKKLEETVQAPTFSSPGNSPFQSM